MPAHMAATMEGLNKIKEESIDLVRFGPSSLLFVYPVLVFLPINLLIWFMLNSLFSFGSIGLQLAGEHPGGGGFCQAQMQQRRSHFLDRKLMRVPPCLAPTN